MLSIIGREGCDEFVFQTLVAEQIDFVPDDGRSRVARTGLGQAPVELGSSLGPFFEEPGFTRASIPLRAAPLRPVICSQGRNCAQDHEHWDYCHWRERIG